MLRELFDDLAKNLHLARRETQITSCARQFVLQPDTSRYEEVRGNIPPDKRHHFGTVAGLAAYLQHHVDKELRDQASVFVGPNGVTAWLNEEDPVRFDVVKIPFFDKDLPDVTPMEYCELLAYLDQHTGHISDEANLRSVLSFVRVTDDKTFIVRDTGAATRVEQKSSRSIDAGTDHQPVDIPKEITITLRIGTREYTEPHRFRLTVSTSPAGPSFRLAHIDRDKVLDCWMEACILDLKDALGDGWNVYEGA